MGGDSGAQELRSAFAAFLGEDRFRRFVSQGFKPRLRWWQERAWEGFIAAHPEFAVSLAELEVALRICEVHGRELQQDFVEVFRGNLDYGRAYMEARSRLFPHARTGPFSTEGAPFEGQRAEVFYCPQCRRAEALWRAGS